MRKFITSILLLISVLSLSAQNNDFQIDDEVYDYYVKALKRRSSPECIALADSAVAIARAKNDGKGVCIALTVPIRHYLHTSDIDACHEACEQLRRLSIFYGYPQYYYHAYSQEVVSLLSASYYLRAFNLADKMRQEAERNEDSYGIFLSYRTLSTIYEAKGETASSINNLEKAAAFFTSRDHLVGSERVSPTYSRIADYYSELNQTDSVRYYLAKTREYSIGADDMSEYYSSKCYYAAMIRDRDMFYENFDSLHTNKGVVLQQRRMLAITLADYVWQEKYEKAEEMLERVNSHKSPLYYNSVKAMYYSWVGDYENEALCLKRYFQDVSEARLKASEMDAAELASKMGVDVVRAEAQHKQAKMKVLIYWLLFALILITVIALIGRIISVRIANKKLRQAKIRAERSDRLKTQFVQNMSHEIRTPLNAIVGFSQILGLPDGMNTDEEKAEYSGYVQNNSEMLMMLIDDILDLGDMENGHYRIERREVAVNEICHLAIKSVEYRTPPGVKMYFTTDVNDGYVVNTDPRRVQQILVNYLTNACKHTVSGEIHLHCSTTEVPGSLAFSVTDTGTGVPAELANDIFERFSKVDVFVQGAGLGLNVCQTVARILGGTVYLDTTYTSGARFVFTLPL